MRYFLIKQGLDVIGKSAFSGDDCKVDLLIDAEISKDKSLSKQEVDILTFDSTIVTIRATTEQTAWQTAKTASTVSAFSFIARKLGLE